MRLTANFKLKELVHPSVLERVGARAANFLDSDLAPTIQVLRDKFGRIIVNGEYKGRTFIDSGLREPHGTVGARLSAHKFGNAADCKFADVEPIEVQNYIIQHQSEFPHILRLENALVTKTWLHVETGERENTIRVFNP